MATQVRASVNKIRHDNHIPPLSLTFRSFSAGSVSNTILISNISDDTNVDISFDGTNLFTIRPGGAFSMNFSNQKGYWTKGDGVGELQVIVGSEI